ncbi:hypothetical protein AZ018_002282, partial [Klebsiella pneumoniae]
MAGWGRGTPPGIWQLPGEILDSALLRVYRLR